MRDPVNTVRIGNTRSACRILEEKVKVKCAVEHRGIYRRKGIKLKWVLNNQGEAKFIGFILLLPWNTRRFFCPDAFQNQLRIHDNRYGC
jgi:hypothetical protein